MHIAARLSLLTGIGRMEGTCSSESNLVSQESSAMTALMDRYSASAEDKATVGCFLDFQEIGLPPHHDQVTTNRPSNTWTLSPI